MSSRFRVVFSSACALLALMLCVTYADGVRSEAERTRSEALERFGGEVARIVVATEQLEPGSVVTRANAAELDWASDLAPEGSYRDVDELLGNEITVAVAKGVPLTALNFREGDDIAEVPTGHVALTIPVSDKLGVSRSVTRGTTLAGYVVTGEGTRLVSSGMTVLSDLSAASGTLGSVPQLTISVLPDDAPEVLGASATGDLRLVVPADDVDIVAQTDDVAPEALESSERVGRGKADAS